MDRIVARLQGASSPNCMIVRFLWEEIANGVRGDTIPAGSNRVIILS